MVQSRRRLAFFKEQRMKIEVEVLSLTDDSYELTGEYRIPEAGEYYTLGFRDVQQADNVRRGDQYFIVVKKRPATEVVYLKRPTVMDLCNEIGDIDGYYSVVYQCTGHSPGAKIHNLTITVDYLRKEVRLEGVSNSDLELAE